MHPSTIAAVAALCGHVTTLRRGYRVLELGCGSGANIMSMARCAGALIIVAEFKAAAIAMIRAQGAIVGWTAPVAKILEGLADA